MHKNIINEKKKQISFILHEKRKSFFRKYSYACFIYSDRRGGVGVMFYNFHTDQKLYNSQDFRKIFLKTFSYYNHLIKFCVTGKIRFKYANLEV